jgi:hypothetical protein
MHQDRHIRIRSDRRSVPDVRRLSRALIALAQAQAEQEAQAEDRSKKRRRTKDAPGSSA